LSLGHTLLGLLSYAPMTGYEWKQVFDQSINHFWNAQMSQIYRELNNMEVKGWLNSEIEKQDGKPDITIHTSVQVWMDLSCGKIDGQQAFMEGKYRVEGNIQNLIMFNTLFKSADTTMISQSTGRKNDGSHS